MPSPRHERATAPHGDGGTGGRADPAAAPGQGALQRLAGGAVARAWRIRTGAPRQRDRPHLPGARGARPDAGGTRAPGLAPRAAGGRGRGRRFGPAGRTALGVRARGARGAPAATRIRARAGEEHRRSRRFARHPRVPRRRRHRRSGTDRCPRAPPPRSRRCADVGILRVRRCGRHRRVHGARPPRHGGGAVRRTALRSALARAPHGAHGRSHLPPHRPLPRRDRP